MYERKVVHAIQHKNEKEFHLRYRVYPTKEDRDRTYALIKDGHKDICCVNLTVTAESNEQIELFDQTEWRSNA